MGFIAFLLTFMLTFYPYTRVFVNWVILVNAVFKVLRFRLYYMQNCHYYFYDYCYFVGAYCAVVLVFFPSNLTLLKIGFLHACGAVPLSMTFLGSKLVFHDIDKFTSFYMHYTYFLAFYVIRFWNRDPNSGYVMPEDWEKALDNWGFVEYFKHVG